MRRILILFLVTAYLFACDGGDNDSVIIAPNVNMVVNSYTKECTGVGIFQCMQVQEGDLIGTNKWHHFYGTIEGFDYVPGYRYQLIVTKRKVENPPIDGSSISYHLNKLVSKEKVWP